MVNKKQKQKLELIPKNRVTSHDFEENVKKLTKEYKELDKENDNNNWRRGDILIILKKEFKVKHTNWCEENNIEYNLSLNFRQVAEKFPPKNRIFDLSWWHYRYAKYTNNPKEWLKKTKENNWSVREMINEIKRTKPGGDWLRQTTVWNFKSTEPEFEGLSNLPSQIIKNLLYYYTTEEDLVLDPFAGLGLVENVCKSMNRKCDSFDINPQKDNIQKNDIRKEIPKEIEKYDFIFLDPPYWNIQDYGDELSEGSLEDYYKGIEECIKNCLKVLKIGGKIVLINMNPSEETKVPEGENYIDLCFGCYQILQKYLKPVQRICVPVFKEFDQTRIKIAKENKTLLGTLRDLMIFEKI